MLRLINDGVSSIVERQATLRTENLEIGNCVPECTYVEKRLCFVLKSLRDDHLWPPHKVASNPDMTLKQAWAAMEDKRWNSIDLTENTCGAGDCCIGYGGPQGFSDELTLDYVGEQLEECADGTRAAIRRLCLACVREERYLEEECEH